jgi:hypothetical protein
MTQSNSDQTTRAVPLDYGTAERASVSWWRRARGEIADRLDGFFEFLGQMLAMIGGVRQGIFAVALAMLAGGTGICMDHGLESSGPGWMCIGGFVAGAIIPINKRR